MLKACEKSCYQVYHFFGRKYIYVDHMKFILKKVDHMNLEV